MKKFFGDGKFIIIRNQRGITLIALIIMIIIVLLIAGISITFLTGDNGILNKAVTAKTENLKAESEEELKVKLSEYLVNNQGISDLNQLDGINIDGYEANLSSVGRIIIMTKDNQSYSYLVDDKFNVTSLENTSIVNNGNTKQIDFEPQISINVNGEATIKVPDEIVNQYKPAGYVYLIDGKVNNCSINSSFNYVLLSNKVEIALIDKDNNMSISKSVNTQITIANYSYTGNVQTCSLKAGKYVLEAWGAQGGGSLGGKGSYVKGEIILNNDTTALIYVGGQGSGNLTRTIGAGGFNGGGSAGYGTAYGTAYGGGGASDIRLNSNELSNRIIVAGAGGGGQTGGSLYGGYASGLGTAGTGGLYCCGNPGTGATQTGPGKGGIARVNATGNGNDGALGIGGDGHSAPTYQGGSGGGSRILWWTEAVLMVVVVLQLEEVQVISVLLAQHK